MADGVSQGREECTLNSCCERLRDTRAFSCRRLDKVISGSNATSQEKFCASEYDDGGGGDAVRASHPGAAAAAAAGKRERG